MKKLLSAFVSGVMAVSSVSVLAGSAKEPDYSLWEKFLKYDLCITDFNALNTEEKDLARMIFETEQSADDTVWCQRARNLMRFYLNNRITYLNTERVTIEQLQNASGIRPYGSPIIDFEEGFIPCTPDVIHLDENAGDPDIFSHCDYWLGDSGNSYVTFKENNNGSAPPKYVVTVKEDGEIWEFEAASNLDLVKALNGDDEAKRAAGFIEKNGGWYYKTPTLGMTFMGFVKPFAEDAEKIDETFTIESSVNGSNVTSIAMRAFENAPYTGITLPEHISQIGREAFMNCKYLKKIELGEMIKTVSALSFDGCDSLEEVVFDSPYLLNCDGAFDSCKGLKKAYINVPEVSQGAFSGCTSLADVTFGPAVKKICADAFEDCQALADIELPEKLLAIGSGAFSGTSLSKVTIQPTVEILGALPKTVGGYYGGLSWDPKPNLTTPTVSAFPEGCTIVGYRGTEADRYSQEWGLPFDEIGTEIGDVNIDTHVNMSDAVSLQRFLLGKYVPTGAYYGDMTGDGNVNVFDMIALKDEIVK